MCTCSDALFHAFLGDINTDRQGKGYAAISGDDVCRDIADYRDSYDYITSTSVTALLKKFSCPRCDSALANHRRVEAFNRFRSCNDLCGVRQSPYGFTTDLINEMRRMSEREIGHDYDWQAMLTSSLRCGPGASVGSQGKNSYFEKLFINPFTTTNLSLYSEYKAFMWSSPTWASAEIRRILLNKGRAVSLVKASKLSTVPKNSAVDRTICTEPSLNMFFQLALGDMINRRLGSFYGYDNALQQDRNRKLAKVGSYDNTVATIDLKSASDTISLDLCRAVLPSSLMAAIDDCRSSVTEIDGALVDLHMVSSMGNGFTFPLQTYLFGLAIKAFCRLKDVAWSRYDIEGTSFGVFGDDIIVPSAIYHEICDVLQRLGFTVNPTKSFHQGPFRESCGEDWFGGLYVRNVYISSLNQIQDRFSAINRLNRWSTLNGIPIPQSIAAIIPKGWRRYVCPSDMSDDAGIHIPSSLQKRPTWNYQYFTPKKRVFMPWVRKLVKRVINDEFSFPQTSYCLRRSHLNPLGLLLTASLGRVSSEGLSRRDDRDQTSYVSTRGRTPCWDSSWNLRIGPHTLDFVQWEVYCSANLPTG